MEHDSKPLTEKEKGSSKVAHVLASSLKILHEVLQWLAARGWRQRCLDYRHRIDL